MEKAVFVKLRHRVQVKPDDVILVGDVAQIIASDKQMLQQLKRIPLYRIQRSDKNIVIVDVMKVVDAIVRFDPSLEIQTIGSAQTIVEVVYPKRTISFAYFFSGLAAAFYWLGHRDY